MGKKFPGTFIDNKERHRFELQVDGITAFVDYIINKKGVIYFKITRDKALQKSYWKMFLKILRKES